ncbi:MAG: hypothetical protein K0R09_50 [Clostridiales bacterium]|jgi:uncharacterized membrane protein|nr:hypothetical protein [Clostridiales bacterium]
MGKKKPTTSAKSSVKKQIRKGNNYRKFIALGLVIVVIFITGYLLLGNKANKDNGVKTSNTENSIKIKKEEISSTAKFYPYESDGIKMEVLAVKANDGTIRTALNTCQVCYPSGRGYYIQDGDELECQNCGNRFQLDMIEVIKGGCNPVPVLDENKTDDGTDIIIDNAFLDENRDLFKNWKSE